jgi:hypothetical protein
VLTIKDAKPCPFCGSNKVNICDTHFQPEQRAAYCVSCRMPECHGGVFVLGHGEFETIHAAVSAWNERH